MPDNKTAPTNQTANQGNTNVASEDTNSGTSQKAATDNSTLTREQLLEKLEGYDKGMGTAWYEMKEAKRQNAELRTKLQQYEDKDKTAQELLPQREQRIQELESQIKLRDTKDALHRKIKLHNPVSDRVTDLLLSEITSNNISEEQWEEAIELFKLNEPSLFKSMEDTNNKTPTSPVKQKASDNNKGVPPKDTSNTKRKIDTRTKEGKAEFATLVQQLGNQLTSQGKLK